MDQLVCIGMSAKGCGVFHVAKRWFWAVWDIGRAEVGLQSPAQKQ